MTQTTRLGCACGQVQLEAVGPPIVSTECYCNSCRAAGTRMQTLPEAPPCLNAHGGTRFVLYRKDRVRFLEDTPLLKELRLTPRSKTRRVVATCCNTPVFLEFQNGHWLSLYAGLWPEGRLPPIELRTMTGDLPPGVTLPDDIPSPRTQTLSFFVKLLGAWIAMGFRSPKISAVSGELHV
jgi:hypothetical protein